MEKQSFSRNGAKSIMTDVASICNTISSSFLILGYTKGGNDKYFLAKHESESDHKKLLELEDVITSWINLANVNENKGITDKESATWKR